MAQTSWNDEAPLPTRRFRWKGLALGIAIVVGLLAILGGVLAGFGTANRRLAWPLLLNVAQRLSTDDGARDLWARSPDLAASGMTQEAFLAMAQEARPHLATLPKEEPQHQHDQTWISASPDQLIIFQRLDKALWLHVYANPRTGQGEGLTDIHLERTSTFEDQFKSLGKTQSENRRHQLDQTLAQLEQDESARAFLTKESGLGPEAIGPWLQRVQIFRPHLAELRQDLKDEKNRVRRRSHSILLRRTQTVEFVATSGAGIRLEYLNGRLTQLRLKQPKDSW